MVICMVRKYGKRGIQGNFNGVTYHLTAQDYLDGKLLKLE